MEEEDLFETCYKAYQTRKRGRSAENERFVPNKVFWDWLENTIRKAAPCGNCRLHVVGNKAHVETPEHEIFSQLELEGTLSIDYAEAFHKTLKNRYPKFDLTWYDWISAKNEGEFSYSGHIIYDFEWISQKK
jgi:hypothetical protein